MLLKSRYPERSFLGTDGNTVEFSVWIRGVGGVYGYTWSPSGGLTKEMVESGFVLADYCKATAAERSQRRDKVIARLTEFREKAATAK
jgi:hypothetical protein